MSGDLYQQVADVEDFCVNQIARESRQIPKSE